VVLLLALHKIGAVRDSGVVPVEEQGPGIPFPAAEVKLAVIVDDPDIVAANVVGVCRNAPGWRPSWSSRAGPGRCAISGVKSRCTARTGSGPKAPSIPACMIRC
jgi:hypothetical protein